MIPTEEDSEEKKTLIMPILTANPVPSSRWWRIIPPTILVYLFSYAFGWFRTSFPETHGGIYFLTATLLTGFLFTLSLPAELSGRSSSPEEGPSSCK